MPVTSIPSFWPALPELVLAIGAMALLMLGVFRKTGSARGMYGLCIALLAVAGLAIFSQSGSEVTFGGAFAVDPFIRFMKILAIIGAIGALVMSVHYFKQDNFTSFEYPILIVLAVLA